MSNNVGFFGTKVGAWCNKQTAPPISLVFYGTTTYRKCVFYDSILVADRPPCGTKI